MANRKRTTRVPHVAVPRSYGTLAPTAQSILAAAKEILQAEGLTGLTLDAIAVRAGVNKAATRYHFGSKDGLIEAIVDEVVLNECSEMANDLSPDAAIDERIESFLQGVRRIALDVGGFSGFFDILPHAVRDWQLRQRLVSLYAVWYQWNMDWLGLSGSDDRPEIKNLGRLTAALIDGVAVQALIEPHYDPEPVLAAMRLCLRSVLETVASMEPEANAAGVAPDSPTDASRVGEPVS